jgi:hypothetical protein
VLIINPDILFALLSKPVGEIGHSPNNLKNALQVVAISVRNSCVI